MGEDMPTRDDTLVQLATRIPKRLHHELKLRCVSAEVSLMEFVAQALEEKLVRETGRTPQRAVRLS
jgi:predicted HicB family RNase H-like nuclease